MFLPDTPMLRAVGEVALVAAVVEQSLHVVYWYYAGLKRPIGRIVTDNLRPGKVMEVIIKIAKAAAINPRRLKDLEDVATKYRQLATERNRIVHWVYSQQDASGAHELYEPFDTGDNPSKQRTKVHGRRS